MKVWLFSFLLNCVFRLMCQKLINIDDHRYSITITHLILLWILVCTWVINPRAKNLFHNSQHRPWVSGTCMFMYLKWRTLLHQKIHMYKHTLCRCFTNSKLNFIALFVGPCLLSQMTNYSTKLFLLLILKWSDFAPRCLFAHCSSGEDTFYGQGAYFYFEKQ